MKIARQQKLVMIGDSVTDCGRAQPAGEGLFEAIGKGYVAQVDALLGSTYPDRAIRVVNMGNSGNTVRDLKARWERDVIEQHPDWLSIMIGVNDVWRQFDLPRQPETHVYLDEYTQTLDELVATTKSRVKGLVLMTPYYIESNPQDAMRAQMDRYGAAVKAIAAKHDTLFVDTQAAFNRVLEHCHSAAISWDRVHPNHIGHMTLARAFLQAVEFVW
ncbi:MAG TPA: SGNH/GDSL hydrolase family protein [Armatimonadota bacterium]|jgi:lysophospholipase L1-like esterase